MGPLQFNKNQNIGEMVGSFVYASNWKLFSNGKQNKKYQSVFGSNDVIGCGLKKSKGLIKKCLPGDDFRIFWTLNGAKLGRKMKFLFNSDVVNFQITLVRSRMLTTFIHL